MFALSKTGYSSVFNLGFSKHILKCSHSTKARKIFLELQENLIQADVNMGLALRSVEKIEPSIEALFYGANSLWSKVWGAKNRPIFDHYMSHLHENAEVLIRDGYPVKTDLLFRLLSDLSAKGLVSDKYPLTIALLVENAYNIEKTDERGWTLLHWAVFGKNLEVVNALLKRRVNTEAQENTGLKAKDLSNWTMNRPIIEILNPGFKAAEILSNIKPDFFAETIKKLNRVSEKNHYLFSPCYYGWLEKSLPDLESIKDLRDLSVAEKRYLDLYKQTKIQPINLYSKNHFYSPMGLAIHEKNIFQVIDLLTQGWNYEIEGLYTRKRWSEDTECTTGFKIALKEHIENDESTEEIEDYEFHKQVIEMITGSRMSGITEHIWNLMENEMFPSQE